MGSKSAKAPDYTAAAEKQGESSMNNTVYQTNANRVNQVTPFGTQTWAQKATIDPVTGKKTPQYTQTTTLDPMMQRALDAQQNLTAGRSEIGAGMLDRIQKAFGPEMNWDSFDKAGGRVQSGKLDMTLGDSKAFMGQAGDALMAQFNDRMNPQFQMQEAQMDTTLRNRGVKPGDAAYDNEMAKVRQQQGDQRNQAMYQAQQLQAGEASRLQDMDAQSGSFMNTAEGQRFQQAMQGSQYDTQRRQQQIAEEQLQRNQALNEANAVIEGQQVAMPTMPSYNTAGRAETTQYSQAAGQQYQASQDAANAANAMTGQILGAVSAPFSLGG